MSGRSRRTSKCSSSSSPPHIRGSSSRRSPGFQAQARSIHGTGWPYGRRAGDVGRLAQAAETAWGTAAFVERMYPHAAMDGATRAFLARMQRHACGPATAVKFIRLRTSTTSGTSLILASGDGGMVAALLAATHPDRVAEVVVSQTVKDLVAGSGVVVEEAGEHELRGVPERWRVYRVVG